jgi:hypothetical protein
MLVGWSASGVDQGGTRRSGWTYRADEALLAEFAATRVPGCFTRHVAEPSDMFWQC